MTDPLSLALPALDTSPALARQFVTEALSHRGLRHCLDEVLVVVSELVENAIRHTGGGCQVRLEFAPGQLVLGVADGSQVMPRFRRQEGLLQVRGRGLLLVDRLADRWGAELTATGGKLVWARLVLGPRPPPPSA